ncbi:MAG: polyprenyl diphosphate synthase [bacterium]|nr:polyprenyl diphosphate synthase [bacterium]
MSDQKLIKHVGIILDGNRRWAKEKGLKTLEGHKQGAEALRDVAIKGFDVGYDKGLRYMTAYIFSNENWNRTEEEVGYLMKLMLKTVEKYLDEIHEKGIKILILGRKNGLRSDVQKALDKVTEKTKDNTRATLALCFNYGGKEEIVDAVNASIAKGTTEVSTENIEQNLYSPEVPPVDLIIRTSGEKRTSGFMLWRAAYSELYFVDKYWPDFTVNDFKDALDWYTNRERRFGK